MASWPLQRPGIVAARARLVAQNSRRQPGLRPSAPGRGGIVIVIEPRGAYRLWAPTYCQETAISHLDEEMAAELSPSPRGKRLLDAGCGTGRRLTGNDAALAAGVDLSSEMLSSGTERAVAVADVRALPFAEQSFDLVWCRLVLGHLPDPRPAYGELARVCRIGGKLFVSDFHAAAAARGH